MPLICIDLSSSKKKISLELVFFIPLIDLMMLFEKNFLKSFCFDQDKRVAFDMEMFLRSQNITKGFNLNVLCTNII